MAQMTPAQKKAQAARRNGLERARLSEDDGAVDAQDPDAQAEPVARRVPTDHRAAQRAANEGKYTGPKARPRPKAFGTDALVVTYEDADWYVNPAPLDNWDDLEETAESEKPMGDASAAKDAVRITKALFFNDPETYAGFKEHIRERYGYVSRNVVFDFINTVREEAESLGN